MRGWPKILADCDRLLSPADESVSMATNERQLRHRARPEAAFRITLRGNKDRATRLENIVGGIPKITPCVVHSVPSLPDARWLHPDEEDQPVGVVMRRPAARISISSTAIVTPAWFFTPCRRNINRR